jgi:phosphatidylglycerophosphatase A
VKRIKKQCDFSKLVATFFYVGFISRKAPGTVGSLFSLIICIILYWFGTCRLLLPLTIIVFFLGIICSHIVLIQQKEKVDLDPGYIIIDEVCGIFLGSLILYLIRELSIISIICNFVLFRIFDILKPFPIRKIESICKKSKYTFAFGIMIDDILASIIATSIQLILLNLLH